MSMIFNFIRVSEDELNQYLADSSLLEERIHNDGEADSGMEDIDQSWEGILFLLTGQPLSELDHPLGAALFSGQVINEEQDLGYGPAQYLMPKQVKVINEQLSGLSTEELMGRYDAVKMKELGIYPSIWDRTDEGILDYLREYVDSVKDVYALAAKENQGVITFLN